jgi:GNAT superfamily N-acetyltransferase
MGFCILKEDELYQLYVAAQSRGAGVAAALLAERGVARAWLTCAIGNHRAARFYEKSGWRRTRNMISILQTAEGPFQLEVWRHEKVLARPA